MNNKDMMKGQAVAVATDDARVLVERLTGELQRIDELCSKADVRQRHGDAADARLAYWPGQSADGRKGAEQAKKGRVFPFPGSSDARIMLVDEVVNEKVCLQWLAFWSAELQTDIFNLMDSAESQRVSALLEWVRLRAMPGKLSGEILLLGNIMHGSDPGVGVLEVTWKREMGVERVRISREQLLQLLQAAAPEAVEADLDNVLFEDQLREVLMGKYPLLEAKLVDKALKRWRKSGVLELAAPVVMRAYPQIRALRLWQDVWVDPFCDSFAEAPVALRRELLYEHELRARELSDDYDGDWIAKVVACEAGGYYKGNASVGNGGSIITAESLEATERRGVYEVWTARERRYDEDTGLPEIWETVYHTAVPDMVGKEAVQDFEHGEMPFHEVRREMLDRGMAETRGIPRVISTHQTGIKVLRDTANDYAQLMTIPPYLRRRRAGAVELVMQPAAEIVVERMDEFEWLKPPSSAGFHGSSTLEERIRGDVDRVMGRHSKDGSPRADTIEQVGVSQFLNAITPAFGQAARLSLQYMDEVELADIIGEFEPEEKPTPRGMTDLAIRFDTRDLDMEFLKSKMSLIGEFVVSLDTGGLLDRRIVKDLMRMIDPMLAARYVQDSDSVTEKEVDAELQNLVMIVGAGIEPRMVEKGQNHALRLQVIEQALQSSPKVAEAAQADPNVQKILQARMQHLGFQVQQEKNKAIGRRGASAATAGPAN